MLADLLLGLAVIFLSNDPDADSGIVFGKDLNTDYGCDKDVPLPTVVVFLVATSEETSHHQLTKTV